MNFTRDTKVRDIALSHPAARRVLEAAGSIIAVAEQNLSVTLACTAKHRPNYTAPPGACTSFKAGERRSWRQCYGLMRREKSGVSIRG